MLGSLSRANFCPRFRGGPSSQAIADAYYTCAQCDIVARRLRAMGIRDKTLALHNGLISVTTVSGVCRNIQDDFGNVSVWVAPPSRASRQPRYQRSMTDAPRTRSAAASRSRSITAGTGDRYRPHHVIAFSPSRARRRHDGYCSIRSQKGAGQQRKSGRNCRFTGGSA